METECKNLLSEIRNSVAYRKIPIGLKYKGKYKSELNKKELCELISKIAISKSKKLLQSKVTKKSREITKKRRPKIKGSICEEKQIKRKKEKIEIENLFEGKCFDYRECLISTKTKNGLNYIIIPKKTILFHGTRSKFPNDIVPTVPAFYSDLKIAAGYAFRSEEKSHKGENAKIITVQVVKDIKLLLITPNSLKKLSTVKDFPLEAFKYAFSFGKEELYRRSLNFYDKIVTLWLCKQRFDGWIGLHLEGFHDEVVLCKKRLVKRYPIEIRFDERIPECAIITIDGDFCSVLRAKEDLEGIYYTSSGKQLSKPKYSKNPKSDHYILYLNNRGYEKFPECKQRLPWQHSHIIWKHKNPFI